MKKFSPYIWKCAQNAIHLWPSLLPSSGGKIRTNIFWKPLLCSPLQLDTHTYCLPRRIQWENGKTTIHVKENFGKPKYIVSSFRLCHNSHTAESKRSKSRNLYTPGARVIQGWKKPAQKFVMRQVLEDAGQKNWSNGHIEVLEKLSKLKELPSNIQLQILITGQHFFSLLREITQPWIPWVFTPGWVQWLWKCECCRFSLFP